MNGFFRPAGRRGAVLWILPVPILLIPAAALPGGRAGSGPPAVREALPADLQTAVDAFYASVEADDGEARAALFADDAIMMPNHWTRTEGRDAIGAGLRSAAGRVFRIRNREVVDHGVSDGLAYLANAYEYTWHPAGDPPQWHRTKNVHIWRRAAVGVWKLHLDIWNSDVPLDRFATEGRDEQENGR